MSNLIQATVNGWYLLMHPLFEQQIESLLAEVSQLKKKTPEFYKQKNATKRLAAITHLMFEKIPQNPTLPEYRQGSTLGDDYKHWFRAKFFQQYRLFFRYHLKSKIIVYAWINDEDTKRADGSQTDAYAIFKKMLKKGKPPNDWNALLKESKAVAKLKD